jgi:hypothetical protein
MLSCAVLSTFLVDIFSQKGFLALGISGGRLPENPKKPKSALYIYILYWVQIYPIPDLVPGTLCVQVQIFSKSTSDCSHSFIFYSLLLVRQLSFRLMSARHVPTMNVIRLLIFVHPLIQAHKLFLSASYEPSVYLNIYCRVCPSVASVQTTFWMVRNPRLVKLYATFIADNFHLKSWPILVDPIQLVFCSS